MSVDPEKKLEAFVESLTVNRKAIAEELLRRADYCESI